MTFEISKTRPASHYSEKHSEFFFPQVNKWMKSYAFTEEDAVWLEYETGTFNRFLQFNLINNTFTTILKCMPGAGLDLHFHPSQVIAYCIQGSWKYDEFDWVAKAGSVIYEPPGEAHTLRVIGDEGMTTFFHVSGPLVQVDKDFKMVGYVDAFILRQNAYNYYEEHGLDTSYLDAITIK